MKKFLFILFLLIFFSGCGSEFNNLDVKLNKQQINNNMIVIKGKVKKLELPSYPSEINQHCSIFFNSQKNRIYLKNFLTKYDKNFNPEYNVSLIININQSKLTLKKSLFWPKDEYELNTYSSYNRHDFDNNEGIIYIGIKLKNKSLPFSLKINPVILLLKNIDIQENNDDKYLKNLQIEVKILKNHNEVFIENQILSSLGCFNNKKRIKILANLINQNIIKGKSVQVRKLILKSFLENYYLKFGNIYKAGIKLMKRYPEFKKAVINELKYNKNIYIKPYSNPQNLLNLVSIYLSEYVKLLKKSPKNAKELKIKLFKVLNEIVPYVNRNHVKYPISSNFLWFRIFEKVPIDPASDYPFERVGKIIEFQFELIKYLLNKDIIDPYYCEKYEEYYNTGRYNYSSILKTISDFSENFSIFDKYKGLILKYKNETPIIFFAKKENFIMLKFLLNNDKCRSSKYKHSHYCTTYKEVNNLDINEEDKKGKTALYYAIQNQNLKIVKLLLENGANPNQFDSLSLAAKLNNLDILKILLSFKANINNSKVLNIAFKNKNQKVINYIFNLSDLSLKQNTLNEAVKYGTFENVKTLLKKGLKPTEKTFEYALERGDEKIINYLYTHYEIPINTKILAIIVNKNMFPLYKNIIKNKPVSCDQIEEVAKLNNKKYISLMKKYKSKKIKECIKGLEYYLQDYTNPNFDSISRNNIKALKILYSRYYNINVPQKVTNFYNKYYQKYLAYIKRKAKEPKTYSIEDCYNGAGGARCCVVTINGEDRGSICYQWDSSYKHYTIFPVWGSKIYENGYYDPNLHMIWTTKCGYSSSGSVYSISDALNKFLNCVANGHY